MHVSVIICTYNGAKLLPETLRHLALQQVPEGFSWEILLIDNGSIDDSLETGRKEWQKYTWTAQFKALCEPKAGKLHALETAFARAEGRYLLICDQDNWLSKDYVQLAYSIMEKNSRIGALGGYNRGVFEGDIPGWFESCAGWFAVGRPSAFPGDITESRGWVCGAGMIVRKDAYTRLKNAGTG